MGTIRKYTFLIMGLCLVFIFAQCTDYQETVPFFDELYLEYNLGGNFKRIYNISNVTVDKFKIVEINKRGALGDTTENIFVDIFGQVYESTYSGAKGTFAAIWLPVKEMKTGDTFDYLEGDKYIIADNRKWEKWNVVVVRNISFGYERYYETNTGFWVGSSSDNNKFILDNTNATIPTIE